MAEEDGISLWIKKRIVDSHFAQSSTLLKPQMVDVRIVGHHISCVFMRGVRTFMFENQKSRDRFVNFYRGFEARPCKDPVP